MGLLPKKEMQRLKAEKRKAKEDKKRKVAVRNVAVSFLIVCEGEKTEPQYFTSLIKDRVSRVREVDIQGEGRGTVSLVKQALSLVEKSSTEYDRVWVVFDKDDFEDFNQAITLANSKKIHCAWSNEAFELWYYLHFQYLDTGINRDEYCKKLEREIKRCTGDSSYKYKKGDKETYRLLKQYGNEQLAIKYAKRLKSNCRGRDYESHKPCTMVYKLVEELNNPEILLNS